MRRNFSAPGLEIYLPIMPIVIDDGHRVVMGHYPLTPKISRIPDVQLPNLVVSFMGALSLLCILAASTLAFAEVLLQSHFHT